MFRRLRWIRARIIAYNEARIQRLNDLDEEREARQEKDSEDSKRDSDKDKGSKESS